MRRYSGGTLALCLLILQGCACTSRTPQPTPPSGAHLFQSSCAGCHGTAARGNGPIADYLTVRVPDLTRIAERRGGAFPEEDIFRIIDGQAELSAHGARHMPIWGYEFFGDAPDDELAHRQATDKVDRLVSYLRSIQRAD